MAAQRLALPAAAVALGAALALPGFADAVEIAKVQASLRSDGNGVLVANTQTNPPEETWTWQVCAPDHSSCTPFGAGRYISTAGAPANVVFKALASAGAFAFSPVWHGLVASQAPPSISGELGANQLVTPVPGQWSGGWDGDFDVFQLAACATAAGHGCTTLTEELHYSGCPNGAAVIDPVFAGRYLRVAARRLGVNSVFPAYAVSSPYGVETWPLGPTVSAAMVGRIASATGPRAANCGPPPLVQASISKRGVAKVICGLGCRAVLVARRGAISVRVGRDLSPLTTRPRPKKYRDGPPRLRLPRRALASLGPGRARIKVLVDGKVAARRTVFLG